MAQHDWGRAFVLWVARNTYMVKTFEGSYYGPWGSRPVAEHWLQEKRGE